ncbi:hypothetical protein [Haliangium sp.]|uniref:hypothetical protein n=1 Tax=Haliangium sp. TaxID=2663208 RepID=UPI003D09C273
MFLDVRCTARHLARAGSLAASLAAALILIPGCSDDSGGAPDAAPPDAAPPDAYAGDGIPPTVEVAFPPPSSLTDAPTITLRGSAEDVDAIAAIRINGVDVTTNDGFATWTATVTLSHGDNTIAIESEDEYGAVDTAAATVHVELSANWIDSPSAVAADPANNRALVFDFQLDALLSVDLTTGERVVISDDVTGNGPRLERPIALVLDPASGNVLGLDVDAGRFFSIDLSSGDRTEIAGPDVATGPEFVSPRALALDTVSNRALIIDVDTGQNPAAATLYSVALDTGARTVIADGTTGGGDDLVSPQALAFDPGDGTAGTERALVADVDAGVATLYSVDLTSGDRTPIAVGNNDTPPFSNPTALVVDTRESPATKVFLLEDGSGTGEGILSVDLSDGTRTFVSQDTVSTGQDFSVPVALALEIDPNDAANSRLLVTDSGLDEVLSVDLSDGARTVLTAVALGVGPELGAPRDMLYDAPTNRVIIVDQQDDDLIGVDLNTSARMLLAAGDGDPSFGAPVTLSYDFYLGLAVQAISPNAVVVVDTTRQVLYSVNLSTGALTVLSGAARGEGPAFTEPMGVAFDPGDAGNSVPSRFLVVDKTNDALYAVDPATGNRSVVSDGATGTGDPLDDPVAVMLEMGPSGRTGRALVLTFDPGALIAVDLVSGDRTVLSSATVGSGVELIDEPFSMVTEFEPGASNGSYVPTGSIIVTQRSNNVMLAIRLEDGRRTPLYDSQPNGKGPPFDTPRAIWQIPENNTMLVVDEGHDAVLMLDRETDQRVVVSR